MSTETLLLPDFPKPIRVMVFYDRILQAITGKELEVVWVSEGMVFRSFLGRILSSYPQIEILHPPGVLGFAVNGVPPDPFYVLQDGDLVEFVVHEEDREFYEQYWGDY